jgi:hypothetical protein
MLDRISYPVKEATSTREACEKEERKKNKVENIFSHSDMPEYCIIINMDKCFIDSMNDMREEKKHIHTPTHETLHGRMLSV